MIPPREQNYLHNTTEQLCVLLFFSFWLNVHEIVLRVVCGTYVIAFNSVSGM